MNVEVFSALVVLGALGFVFGIGLAVASRILYVRRDSRIMQIEEVLPGANCGACGAPGCSGFAEGVVKGKYPANGCIVGGEEVAVLIADILGTKAGEIVSKVAVVRCKGGKEHSEDRAIYRGIMDCRAAELIDNGAKGCIYGCLSLGSCVDACPFDAMVMGEQDLPIVDEDLCTGCGECVRTCPREIMELIPRTQKVFIACVSKDFGKAVKSVCKVGCIGCGLCANPKTTRNEIITMDGKLPVIHYDRVKDPWGDLENAVHKCPTKSFGIRGEELQVLKKVDEEETIVT